MIDCLKVAAHWMEKAGAIIAVVMDPASRWWIEDGSAAVENMLIASTALGYGSCWLEGYTLPREGEFKLLLGVPKEKRLLTLMPIGVPTEWPTREKKIPGRDYQLGAILDTFRLAFGKGSVRHGRDIAVYY